MERTFCNHDDKELYVLSKEEFMCYLCAYEEEIPKEQTIRLSEYDDALKGNYSRELLQRLFKLPQVKDVFGEKPLYKSINSQSQTLPSEEYLEFIQNLNKGDQESAFVKIHAVYDSAEKKIREILHNMRKKDCAFTSDTNCKSISLGGSLKLKAVTPEQWKNRPENKTRDQIYKEMQDLLSSRWEVSASVLKWIDHKFIGLKETKAKCKAFKEASIKARQRRVRVQINSSDSDGYSEEDQGEDEFTFTTTSWRFIFKTEEWIPRTDEHRCVIVAQERIKTRNKRVYIDPDWIQFNTCFSLFPFKDEKVIQTKITKQKMTQTTYKTLVQFESFGEISEHDGDHCYSNGFQYSEEQGMQNAKRNGRVTPVELPVKDGIPHGDVKDLVSPQHLVNFSFVDGERLENVYYTRVKITGTFSNGLFTGLAVLHDEGDMLIFDGQIFKNVIFSGMFQSHKKGVLFKTFYDKFMGVDEKFQSD